MWGVPRVTFASTIGVYGGLPDMSGLREDVPLPMSAAGNLVAASKKSAELVSTCVAEGAGFEIVNPRLGAIWGPLGRKQSRFFAAPALIHAAVAGTPPDSSQTHAGPYAEDAIDVLYVKDCARAIALLQTTQRLSHTTYNVGSGHATTNGEIAAVINGLIPDAKLGLQPGPNPNSPTGDAYLDTARLREDTGFEPEYDLEAAVADYVAWLRAGNDR